MPESPTKTPHLKSLQFILSMSRVVHGFVAHLAEFSGRVRCCCQLCWDPPPTYTACRVPVLLPGTKEMIFPCLIWGGSSFQENVLCINASSYDSYIPGGILGHAKTYFHTSLASMPKNWLSKSSISDWAENWGRGHSHWMKCKFQILEFSLCFPVFYGLIHWSFHVMICFCFRNLWGLLKVWHHDRSSRSQWCAPPWE